MIASPLPRDAFRGRALCLVLALLSAIAVEARAATPAQASRGEICSSTGSRTVYATSLGRVFTKPRRVREPVRGGPRFYTAHYSCAHRYNRRFLLAESEFAGEDEYGPFRFAGPFLAYAFFPSCAACEERQGSVMVQSLRTGRHLYDAEAIEHLDTGDESVTDLVVKRNGSVAWIAIHDDPPATDGEQDIEVNKRDRSGRARLDTGPGLGPRSLELRGSTLSWSKAGQRVSATLR